MSVGFMRKDGRANERRKMRMKKGERFERRKRGKSETGKEGPTAGVGFVDTKRIRTSSA